MAANRMARHQHSASQWRKAKHKIGGVAKKKAAGSNQRRSVRRHGGISMAPRVSVASAKQQKQTGA